MKESCAGEHFTLGRPIRSECRCRKLARGRVSKRGYSKSRGNGLTKTAPQQLIGSSKQKGNIMAGKGGSADSVYKVVELVGTSSKSWEDAAKNAVETAAGSLRDLRVAEIVKLDMTVENGKVGAYRARVLVSFKYGR